MKKYLTIISATWQRSLTYRFTVFAFLVGEIMEILILVLMWSAIYENQRMISGYTLREMITYILVGNFITVLTRNFLDATIARDIKEGSLSLFLMRPMSYFSYIITRELGRISLAFIMSSVSQIIVILFFTKTLIIHFNSWMLSELFVMVVLAFVLEMLISYLFSLCAFWTDEVDGIFATLNRLRKFFSGGYFPLNLLPSFFVTISYLLPFAYSFFVPTQLYLGKISLFDGLKGLGVQIIWILLLYCIIKLVWKKGLRKYEGVGI